MGAFSERPTNRILDALSGNDFSLLQRRFELVTLEPRQVLERPCSTISHVYFITSGAVSICCASSANRSIEVGIVGCEGMTGLGVVLGCHRSANTTIVQANGTALRLSSLSLRQAMAASPTLSAMLLRYAHAFFVQVSRTALANGCATIKERLARRLLMGQDRLQTSSLELTHSHLATLLGVRRPGVTNALHELEGLNLVKSARNRLSILDRDGLQSLAGEYYGRSEVEYEQVLSNPEISEQLGGSVPHEISPYLFRPGP